MLDKVITSLTPNYNKITGRTIFLLLFTLAFFLRLPFFFRDYIDRDESTFILIGQSWVDGHLPYTELWDVKPPITFLFFASIIYTFGKSFLAIRFFGTLLVAITAFFTYKIGDDMGSKKIGFWVAIGCVLLQSMFGSIQGVMSEHICMAFFMPGLFMLIKKRTFLPVLGAGILMGLSVMTKLNIAYAILFLGLYFIYSHFRKKEFGLGLRHAFAYGSGIILVIALTILPYYLQDKVDLWWQSVVRAPLEYADARRYSILKLAPTFLILAGFFFFAWKKKYLDFRDTSVQIVMMAILGVLLSFIKVGRINSHYLIQLYPILIILIGIVVSQISLLKKLHYKPYVFFSLLLLPIETYSEYFAIIKNKIEYNTFYNGEGITVPAYIVENNIDTTNILFTEYHIGYWVLGNQPLIPVIFVKQRCFPFMTTREKLLWRNCNILWRKLNLKQLLPVRTELFLTKKRWRKISISMPICWNIIAPLQQLTRQKFTNGSYQV